MAVQETAAGGSEVWFVGWEKYCRLEIAARKHCTEQATTDRLLDTSMDTGMGVLSLYMNKPWIEFKSDFLNKITCATT